MGSDGFVRAQDLPSKVPQLRKMTMVELRALVQIHADEYEMVERISGSELTNGWYIRALQGHTIAGVRVHIFKECAEEAFNHDTIVYRTTATNLKRIRAAGAVKRQKQQEFLELELKPDPLPSSNCVLMTLDMKRAFKNDLRFSIDDKGETKKVLTRGNSDGNIPLGLFTAVQVCPYSECDVKSSAKKKKWRQRPKGHAEHSATRPTNQPTSSGGCSALALQPQVQSSAHGPRSLASPRPASCPSWSTLDPRIPPHGYEEDGAARPAFSGEAQYLDVGYNTPAHATAHPADQHDVARLVEPDPAASRKSRPESALPTTMRDDPGDTVDDGRSSETLSTVGTLSTNASDDLSDIEIIMSPAEQPTLAAATRLSPHAVPASIPSAHSARISPLVSPFLPSEKNQILSPVAPSSPPTNRPIPDEAEESRCEPLVHPRSPVESLVPHSPQDQEDVADSHRRWLIVPIAMPGCGKTGICAALHHLFGFAHVQVGDFPAHQGKLRPRQRRPFLDAVSEAFLSNDVVIADRNNHLLKHRADLRQAYLSDPRHHGREVTILALNWSLHQPSPLAVHSHCTNSIMSWRQGHKWFIPRETDSLHTVLWKFLDEAEPLGPDEADANIEMEPQLNAEDALQRVVSGIVRIMDVLEPSPLEITQALDFAREYNPRMRL